MTTITVIDSGSKRNGYIITSGEKSLILELGCKTLDYFNACNGEMVGGVCSHRHSDHINPSTVDELMRRGVPVYVGEKVYEEIHEDFNTTALRWLSTRQKRNIGGFTVQPFEVAHNVPNYGFLIETPTKERIVFVTDAIECRYKFKDINCLMIECNHDDDTLLDNLDRHEVSMSHPENHLSLKDCIAFCKANDNPSLKQVILVHLSHTNINEDFALKSVQDDVPNVRVAVAHSGDDFEIESDNF